MKYGSKKISKAGNIALTSPDKKEVNDAISIINDWRSLHLVALDELQNCIIPLLRRHNVRSFSVSRRLKRISSILNKLDRNPKSGLGTMQDIGGLRIIVPSMVSLQRAYSIIIENIPSNFEFTKAPMNYIDAPKDVSGYRSIHFIYKYHSDNSDVDGMKIELQLRTKLQHSWAMAVETAELVTGTALKSSQGDENWITFFKVVSSLFAIKEKQPILKEHKEMNYGMKDLMLILYLMNSKYHFNDTLKALRVSNIVAKKENHKDGYYILTINFETKRVSIKAFAKEDEEQASALYSKLEQSTIDREKENAVVLVSVPQMQQLQEAYPSYFLDTSKFLDAIDTMMNNCQRWGWVKKRNQNEFTAIGNIDN